MQYEHGRHHTPRVASVNVLHNIVHVVIGLAGLSGGRSESGGISFCKTFGVILLIVGLLGFVQPNLFGISRSAGTISGSISSPARYLHSSASRRPRRVAQPRSIAPYRPYWGKLRLPYFLVVPMYRRQADHKRSQAPQSISTPISLC